MTKIFIYSPTDVVSGGVNSLHLLCKALRENNFDASMFYINPQESFLQNSVIRSFDVPYTLFIEDSQSNLLVVPEAKTHLLHQYSSLKKMVYWLGIYFYFKTGPHRFPLNLKPFRRLFYCTDYYGISSNWYHSLAKKVNYWNKKNDPIWNPEVMHISNSYYAARFIKSMGVQSVSVLHNPIRDEYYNQDINSNRENTVIYGPKTSVFLMKKLSTIFKDHQFIRLKRLKPEEVKNLYRNAKLFIELGNFAGRDRMPREAVLSGCVILSSNNGSAACFNDMQIPDYYKINRYKRHKQELIAKVGKILNDYEKHYIQMTEYVEYLKIERTQFSLKATNIFQKLV